MLLGFLPVGDLWIACNTMIIACLARNECIVNNCSISIYVSLVGKKASIFEENAEGAPKREVGKIAVSFTHREFPTPERESVRPKEEEVMFSLLPRKIICSYHWNTLSLAYSYTQMELVQKLLKTVPLKTFNLL
jgi:hypothetical protein